MTIRLQEVVRSEVEGGLSGPANPIPSQSIDCGCKQLPCPKLARFATRRLFVGLMFWVGLVQAGAYAYFHVTGPSIARRFQFDPYLMEWVLLIPDLTPFLLGVIVAYWGDRVHRAAWIGGVILLQSISYFIMIIPHLTHQTTIIDATEKNVTHMPLYSDDHPELCLKVPQKMITTGDEPCYFTFGALVVVQIISGIGNIVYLALGISYVDDNTKKRHMAVFIGVLLSAKIMGSLLGYILAWTCLRVDAVTLNVVESYKEQIGAWWLGLPIFTILLIIPGLLLSWFPRMLPSEVVEQAAASLLNNSGRYTRTSRRLCNQKVGSPNFWTSLGRLFINKTFMCNVLASTLYVMAIVNFMSYENLIIQSKFHAPRPTGLLLGFGDPMSSRLITTMLKPILIGLIVIVSGLAIAKGKPSVKYVVGYSIIVALLSAAIIFAMTAIYCEKKPIVGTDSRGNIVLLKYCNKDCGCSDDAQFRPVCDSKGMFTFYSPCHAGCTSSEVRNGVTIYGGCSCVEKMTGSGSNDVIDGPCDSNTCQTGWLIFEFGTLLAYALLASSFVGDFLVVLRSVYAQDKAISVGFWMMIMAIIVNVPGKFLYELIANLTCQYWGTQKTVCHLHDSFKFNNYLCFLTGSLLLLCALLKIALWFFSKDMKLYVEQLTEDQPGAEMQKLIQNPALESKKETEPSDASNNNNAPVEVEVNNETVEESTATVEESSPIEKEEIQEAPLKYGPLGPGNRRANLKNSPGRTLETRKSAMRDLDSEDELSSSDDDFKKDSSPKVAYRPLDLDSSVESDLSNTEPRSRKRILSRDFDRISEPRTPTKGSPFKREFPNPDNYENPRMNGRMAYNDQNKYLDGSSKTSSFEFSKQRQENSTQKKGDFNEVGIPIVETPIPYSPNPNVAFLKDVKSLINKYELNAEKNADGDELSIRSGESGSRSEGKTISGIPLVAMASKRSSSRGQSSSGFSSLVDGKIPEDRPESRESNSPRTSSKGSMGTLHTDF